MRIFSVSALRLGVAVEAVRKEFAKVKAGIPKGRNTTWMHTTNS
jgi:hypothetical protein